MLMPEPDADVLAKRQRVVAALRAIVPGEGVIADDDELRAYECDALTAYQGELLSGTGSATAATVAAATLTMSVLGGIALTMRQPRGNEPGATVGAGGRPGA